MTLLPMGDHGAVGEEKEKRTRVVVHDTPGEGEGEGKQTGRHNKQRKTGLKGILYQVV